MCDRWYHGVTTSSTDLGIEPVVVVVVVVLLFKLSLWNLW